MSTIIKKIALDQIRDHLEAAYPFEACGFLLGVADDRRRIISRTIQAENISEENQRRRFVIDPLEYLQTERIAARENLLLLGIYHSHPDHPAIPSVHDLEYAQPWFSYFIHSIRDGTMTDTRSYRLEQGQLAEERYCIHFSLQPAIPKHTPSLSSHD